MKKLLTILFLVLLSFYSHSQGLPPDGPYESFHENGQLKTVTNFKNGLWEGLHEGFYENGQLEERGSFTIRQPVL
jgi:antitoxin component YwqK of YwqJK toxin-antitoxin module